jgi:ribA/ribD-fused uncharacterized protein
LIYLGKIDSFRGDFRFLSNFYPSQVNYNGIEFPTVENAYQAAKTNYHEVRLEFVNVSPTEAKNLSKFLDLPEDWHDRKLLVMETLLRIKFSNQDMSELLLMTKGYELIEGNRWNDTFWGVCKEKGHNHLGRLLMETRDWLDSDQIF